MNRSMSTRRRAQAQRELCCPTSAFDQYSGLDSVDSWRSSAHDMHWDYAASFVKIPIDARGRA
jgi:hypothetical protein